MTDPEAALRATLSDELLSSIEQSALEASHYDRASYNLGWRSRDDSWFFKVWREKLIAAVVPLLTPRAWQPMETLNVPDRQGFLVYSPDNMCQYMVFREGKTIYKWASGREPFMGVTLTHWMPLPSPPQERAR